VICDCFRTAVAAGRMIIGMAYTYSTLLVCFRSPRVETIMFISGRHGWFRRVGVAAAALATAAFLIGVPATPSSAQVYGPGYSSAPSQAYPGYSSYAAPYQAYPGYSYQGAYPYPYYPYYPYYYPYWAGWGWPGWGGGWPGISVGWGWGWGGWWGGRGCWNCGFHGGFHGGFAHAGFHGGGFGGGFHGGGGGHR